MVLVFNDTLSGHRLEFFHHIYENVAESDTEYVFIFPEEERERFLHMKWPIAANVKFSTISGLSSCRLRRKFSFLKSEISRLQPSMVILMDIVPYVPFLTFTRTNTKFRGIIMGIYLYTWKKDSVRKKLKSILLYSLISRSRDIDKIFIQADKGAVCYLNRLYKTDKFEYICDPVVPITLDSLEAIGRKYNFPSNKKIVLHPGDISCRKGSVALIKGIDTVPTKYLSDFCIIFAGRVSESCKDEFMSHFESLKQKNVDIFLIEGFLPFNDLGYLISISNYLFIPYSLTNQSSGIVGYAAEFKKPAVVTRSGLLSKIVRRNHLGIIIPNSTPSSISDFFINTPNWIYRQNTYLQENNPSIFANTLVPSNNSSFCLAGDWPRNHLSELGRGLYNRHAKSED